MLTAALIVGGIALALSALNRQAQGKPESDKPAQPGTDAMVPTGGSGNQPGKDDSTGDLLAGAGIAGASALGFGGVALGAAAGYAFSEGYNSVVLQAEGSNTEFGKLNDKLAVGSNVGFTVAGGLIAISLTAAVVVGGITFFAIAVALAVYILLNPHPIPFGDNRRDAAISAYIAARYNAFSEARAALALNFAELTEGQLDCYAAAFADGYARTQDAIVVRAYGLANKDLEGLRLSQGLFAGFESYWNWMQAPKAARDAVAAECNANPGRAYVGGHTFSTNPDVYGKAAQSHAKPTRYQEPAFPTLIEEMRYKWPQILNPQNVHINRRICGLYRNADKSHQWTRVNEYFYDTATGRGFYDTGGFFAWGNAYISAMLAGKVAGKSPTQAFIEGRAAGLIHPDAKLNSLTFSVGDGKTISFNWQDWADKVLLPPPTA